MAETESVAAVGGTSEQDFQTPDRTKPSLSSLQHPHDYEEKKDDMDTRHNSGTNAATVTPCESFAAVLRKENATVASASEQSKAINKSNSNDSNNDHSLSEDNKQVRFDKEDDVDGNSTTSPASSVGGDSPSKRGLVSRRGGRCASPGRSLTMSSVGPSNEAHAAATAVLEFKTFRSPERKPRDENDTIPSLCSTNSTERKDEEEESPSKESDDQVGDNNDENLSTKGLLSLQHGPDLKPTSKNGNEGAPKKGSVTFSPVPQAGYSSDRHLNTPTKSPTGGQFTSLPTLDDDALGSPGAIFLSPTTPTRLERKTKDKDTSELASMGLSSSARTPLTPRTLKRDHERDRLLTTPTDFAFDYGKQPMSGSLLGNSNVLAWLDSPSANGLFSPGGGFGSMLNTPKGGVPRTPRTPTVSSTSFFFSDVASLPREGDFASPKSGVPDSGKRNGRGNNSIICISPLSAHKAKNGAHGSLSPKINMDMFASPAERSGMASLRMKPGVHRGGNLDAVHLADRDLMEDEDLNRLLQLASNTPRPAGPPFVAVSTSEGTVFRSPNEEQKKGDLPTLHLPVIGGKDGESGGTKLARKTSSEASRPNTQGNNGQSSSTPSSAEKQDGITRKPSNVGSSTHPEPHPFMTSYHHHEAAFYPSLYSGISHGGSMRVVVGAPPRSKTGTPPSGTLRYTAGRPGEFPGHYPPSHYPLHHGVPPPHMHPHFPHYPPPPQHGVSRHLPIFSTSTSPIKKQNVKSPVKAGTKRPAPGTGPKQPPGAKKTKKSPQGTPKRKNRSPQLVDKAERQKAAATIQAVNEASGGKNDKAAALAAAILRGVTMRPSGKWQAQLYFAGKSRYIGVFDTREKAALAYEIARERLKSEKNAEGGPLTPKQTESAVNAARKAAFEGVNERDPRLTSSTD